MIHPHPFRLLPITAIAAILSACSASSPETTPAPAPTERPNPWPTMEPNPAPESAPSLGWREQPMTQGDWSYTQAGNVSGAEFRGTSDGARLAIRCDRTSRQVTILRPGSAPSAITSTIRTESGAQSVRAEPLGGQFPALVITLGANDMLLDRIAYSGGRFAVETPGLTTLYLPPYVEISRVIEDCRR